jgi:hypothetical protein
VNLFSWPIVAESHHNEGDRHGSRIPVADSALGPSCDRRLPEPRHSLGTILSGTSMGELLGGGLRIWLRALSPVVKARSPILGLEADRTSRSRHRSSSARSARRFGPHCPSTSDCLETSSCRDCHGSCLRPSTSIRRRADFPHQPNCSMRVPASNLAAADLGAPPRLAIKRSCGSAQ